MKVALFIDGSNLYATQKALRWSLDYKRLLDHFGEAQEDDVIRAYYFTAIRDLPAGEPDPMRPMLDWIEYNGYSVVTKLAKEYWDEKTQHNKIKGNMDVEMCVKMMLIAPTVDMVYLFSGDGDFCSLVDAVQNMGKRVCVVSSIKTDPYMCSDDLRRQADNFIDLHDIRASVEKRDGHIRSAGR